MEIITSRVDSSEAQHMFNCASFDAPPVIVIALSMCTHSKLHLIYIVLHVHLLEGAYIPWMQFVLTVEHAIRAY